VTKRPGFDGEHLTTMFTYGEYDQRKAQFDLTGPLNDTLAYRVSFEEIHSGSYYRLGFSHSTDVYAALRYLPNARLTIDFNTEFYIGHYTVNSGINRPTQQLIDDGLYYQGTGVSPYVGPGQDPRNFLSVITVTGVVPINRRFQLVSPGDRNKGTNFQAQLDATYLLSDSLTLVNKGYFEDYSQLQLEDSERYYNNIKESYNFEDRFELQGKCLSGLLQRIPEHHRHHDQSGHFSDHHKSFWRPPGPRQCHPIRHTRCHLSQRDLS
jgi:hypothetical protein